MSPIGVAYFKTFFILMEEGIWFFDAADKKRTEASSKISLSGILHISEC